MGRLWRNARSESSWLTESKGRIKNMFKKRSTGINEKWFEEPIRCGKRSEGSFDPHMPQCVVEEADKATQDAFKAQYSYNWICSPLQGSFGWTGRSLFLVVLLTSVSLGVGKPLNDTSCDLDALNHCPSGFPVVLQPWHGSPLLPGCAESCEASLVKYNCTWEGSAVFVGLPIFAAPSPSPLLKDVGLSTSFSHGVVLSYRVPVDFSTGLCMKSRPRMQDWILILSHLGLCLFLVRGNSAMKPCPAQSSRATQKTRRRRNLAKQVCVSRAQTRVRYVCCCRWVGGARKRPPRLKNRIKVWVFRCSRSKVSFTFLDLLALSPVVVVLLRDMVLGIWPSVSGLAMLLFLFCSSSVLIRTPDKELERPLTQALGVSEPASALGNKCRLRGLLLKLLKSSCKWFCIL